MALYFLFNYKNLASMRKLKLEIQITVDGFIADPNGNTDWAIWNWAPQWNWDKALQQYHIDLTISSDCILLSSKFVEGEFINHWKEKSKNAEDPQYPFAKAITDMRKVVFTNKLTESKWETVELAKGDLVSEVNRIKNQPGKDIIVYGGAKFVSSLLKASLIDELYLFVNPVAIGSGLSIFNQQGSNFKLKLQQCNAYDCGVIVSKYVPDPSVSKQ